MLLTNDMENRRKAREDGIVAETGIIYVAPRPQIFRWNTCNLLGGAIGPVLCAYEFSFKRGGGQVWLWFLKVCEIGNLHKFVQSNRMYRHWESLNCLTWLLDLMQWTLTRMGQKIYGPARSQWFTERYPDLGILWRCLLLLF